MRPNLDFAGIASDVLNHYQAALGGELELTRYGETPLAAEMPPGWENKIIYGRLRTAFGEIDAMDAPPGRASAVGGNVAIAIDVDDADQGASVFAKLCDGGEIIMPYEQTFYAKRFGMCEDKFGVRWMVNLAPVAVAAR
jgi:PhnB protein